ASLPGLQHRNLPAAGNQRRRADAQCRGRSFFRKNVESRPLPTLSLIASPPRFRKNEETMAPFPRAKRVWLFLAAIVSTLVAALFLFVVTRTRSIEEHLRAVLVQDLSRRFASQVELRTLTLRFWPRLSVTGEGLTVHFHNRLDVPPLISIETFSSRPGIFGLLRE